MFPKSPTSALGFLFLRTNAIPEYGCGLLASFGMGGQETLIWNRIVRTRFPEWVNRPAFIVAEMDLTAIPANPVTLEFVDQIKAEILLEHRMDQPAPVPTPYGITNRGRADLVQAPTVSPLLCCWTCTRATARRAVRPIWAMTPSFSSSGTFFTSRS